MAFLLQSVRSRSALSHLLISAFFTYLLDSVWDIPAIIWWFAVVNGFEFSIFGFDKWCAKRNRKRTPESTFHLMGVLGAFPAIFAGRKIFNHKTSKKNFTIPMWILFILQVLVALAYIESITTNGNLLSFMLI